MKRMSIMEWIRINREEIDKTILRMCPKINRLNDSERRLWVLNDEGLYLWAREDGVNI